jgi:small-conductance mechanosensitive channel
MDDVRELFNRFFTPPVSWPIACGVALSVVIAMEIVYRFLFRWLQRIAGATKTHLDDVLLRRMRIPAQVLVFLVGGNVLFALRDIENATLSQAVTIIELLLVAYLVIEAFETAVVDLWLGERRKVQVPSVVRGLALLVLYTVAVLSVVGSVTGINLAPVLATSTVVTVVLGLALQDTLGNLFAGLALSLEKPFDVGDWILVDNVKARIVQMGWRAVYMQTLSDDVVVMPNAVIAKARVQNFTRTLPHTGRRIEVIVSPSASPDEVEACAKAVFDKIPAARPERRRAWLVRMTPLAHYYDLRVFIDDFGIHDDVESDVRKQFVREASARGLTIAPTPPVAAVSDPVLPA